METNTKIWGRDFPGGPVVKTPRFPLQGLQVRSLVGKIRSHKPRGEAKKKKKIWANDHFTPLRTTEDDRAKEGKIRVSFSSWCLSLDNYVIICLRWAKHKAEADETCPVLNVCQRKGGSFNFPVPGPKAPASGQSRCCSKEREGGVGRAANLAPWWASFSITTTLKLYAIPFNFLSTVIVNEKQYCTTSNYNHISVP